MSALAKNVSGAEATTDQGQLLERKLSDFFDLHFFNQNLIHFSLRQEQCDEKTPYERPLSRFAVHRENYPWAS